jgi:hypothetical protein
MFQLGTLLIHLLCLLTNYRLVVSQNGRALHIVFPHQFLDSPEWFGVSTDEYFQVSGFIKANPMHLLPHFLEVELSLNISDDSL